MNGAERRKIGTLESSIGRPDAVKELHDRVVDHERDADVHAHSTKSRDSAFVEPAGIYIIITNLRAGINQS